MLTQKNGIFIKLYCFLKEKEREGGSLRSPFKTFKSLAEVHAF